MTLGLLMKAAMKLTERIAGAAAGVPPEIFQLRSGSTAHAAP
jgi:hypothetical protein